MGDLRITTTITTMFNFYFLSIVYFIFIRTSLLLPNDYYYLSFSILLYFTLAFHCCFHCSH